VVDVRHLPTVGRSVFVGNMVEREEVMKGWTNDEFKQEIWERVQRRRGPSAPGLPEYRGVENALKAVALAIVYLAECVRWSK
jgi:hypothetical protein